VPAVALLNVGLLVVGGVLPPLVAGWLLRAAPRGPAAEPSTGPARRLDAAALPAGVLLLGLSLLGPLLMVLGNLPAVRDGWLLGVNYAFLALLAGVLGWQAWEAWAGTHTTPVTSGRAA
jgi:hypothetical protein